MENREDFPGNAGHHMGFYPCRNGVSVGIGNIWRFPALLARMAGAPTSYRT